MMRVRLMALGMIFATLPFARALSQESWGIRSVHEKGYSVRIDERPAVLSLSLFKKSAGGASSQIYPTLRAMADAMGKEHPPLPSVAMLLAASKRFDDRLCASLDLLAERGGNGVSLGIKELLERLERAMAGRKPDGQEKAAVAEALAHLRAARQLAGSIPESPAEMETRVRELLREFKAEPGGRKVLGFYGWTPELSGIYLRDTFLAQEDHVTGLPGSWLPAAARALSEDPLLESAYRKHLQVRTAVTNPPAVPSLLGLAEDATGLAAFLPRCRSHEHPLLLKLYGLRSIPEGHEFMSDLVAAIRSGRIDLKPSPDSGWYDWQTWALEPLLRPEATEARKIRREADYERHCEEVFKALWTKRLETHAKRLPGVAFGDAATIWLYPRVTVEPQISLYRRVAESYRFLREALEGIVGREALGAERLFDAGGDGQETLLSGLVAMENHFRGLAALSCCELGADPALLGENVTEEAASKLAAECRARLASGIPAEDLTYDPRGMVPVGYDGTRKQFLCWAVVGVAQRALAVDYSVEPAISVTDDAGRTVPQEEVRINFNGAVHPIPYEVWLECFMNEPLTREELRALCDRCQTVSEIRRALATGVTPPPLVPRQPEPPPPPDAPEDGAAETVRMPRKDWLSRHQSADGHWSSDAFGAACEAAGGAPCGGVGEPGLDVAVTGLALTGYAAWGLDSLRPVFYAEHLAAGVEWLRRVQDSKGRFGPIDGRHFAYGHACATSAMVLFWQSTKQVTLKVSAQQALDALASPEGPHWPWRGRTSVTDEDVAATAWVLFAMAEAAASVDLRIDRPTAEAAIAFLDGLWRKRAAEPPTEPEARPPERAAPKPLSDSARIGAAAAATRARLALHPGPAEGREAAIAEALRFLRGALDSTAEHLDLHTMYFVALAFSDLDADRYDEQLLQFRRLVAANKVVHQTCARDSLDPPERCTPALGRAGTTALGYLLQRLIYW